MEIHLAGYPLQDIYLVGNDALFGVTTAAATSTKVRINLEWTPSLRTLGYAELMTLNRQLAGAGPLELNRIVGQSNAAREIRDYILKVAGASATILITGETGTGKELVAELIHQYSTRNRNRIVTLNCAAIPDSLLESELFGYERGAFTGADTAQEGKLALANGGTLFLDEIGDMTPFAQAKVLRVLESRDMYRLGGRTRIQLDIRFVAATNQKLEELVQQGKFRNDLFFRLNVGRFMLPPLRERAEDIPLLTHHYIQHFNERFGRQVEGCTSELMRILSSYTWPGNVRELRNLVESMYLNGATVRLALQDLPRHFSVPRQAPTPPKSYEKEALLEALRMTNWNKSRAAERLCWSRMTLYRKMAKYGLMADSAMATSATAVQQ